LQIGTRFAKEGIQSSKEVLVELGIRLDCSTECLDGLGFNDLERAILFVLAEHQAVVDTDAQLADLSQLNHGSAQQIDNQSR
jgi:hypothetical protein